MAKIGHASIDENRRAKGGQAGDQGGREVCFSSWYAKGWSYVLRPKNTAIAEKMAKACEQGCMNDILGYDQAQRNSLRTQAKQNGMDLSKITVPCECDCSSFMTVCAECAGIDIPYSGSNAPTTTTMKNAFMSTGQFELLTDPKYLTSDKYLKRGDILVCEGKHTVMMLENGFMAYTEPVKAPAITVIKEERGVDISQYNVITDYKAMAQVKNVIIRIGYRGSDSGLIVEDKSFKTHMDNCVANGMNIGVYFYDQSINEVEAAEQADWVVNRLKGYNLNLPIYIDTEYSKNHTGRADNISVTQRTNNLIAFCDRVKERGSTPGIYSGNHWFENMVVFDRIKHFNIWCARYSTQKPTVPKYDIWQYGSENYSWAIKPIDTNIIYNVPVENAASTPNKPTSTSDNTGVTAEKPIQLMGKVAINEGTLNVRSKPDANSNIVTQLQKGTYIQLLGDLGTWYRMAMGYVSKQYVKEAHGIVVGDNLRLRSTPDTSVDDNIITTLPINTEVIICTAGNGWYCVLLGDGRTGWVNGMYIKLK